MSENIDATESLARELCTESMSAGALARQMCSFLQEDSTMRWMLEKMLADANLRAFDRHMIFSDFEKVDADASLAAKMASFKRLNRHAEDEVEA